MVPAARRHRSPQAINTARHHLRRTGGAASSTAFDTSATAAAAAAVASSPMARRFPHFTSMASLRAHGVRTHVDYAHQFDAGVSSGPSFVAPPTFAPAFGGGGSASARAAGGKGKGKGGRGGKSKAGRLNSWKTVNGRKVYTDGGGRQLTGKKAMDAYRQGSGGSPGGGGTVAAAAGGALGTAGVGGGRAPRGGACRQARAGERSCHETRWRWRSVIDVDVAACRGDPSHVGAFMQFAMILVACTRMNPCED